MYLKKISLVNFKNFDSFEFVPSERINCFIGDNGIGKTNLLDSIHYLSFCKSFINSVDKINIRHEEEFFTIDGVFSRNENDENIYCGVQAGKNKSFRKNGIQYQKLSEHIGFIPLVFSTPTDINLVGGGSEIRRKFADTIISQFDRNYLNNLIAYSKALEQRNYLLKSLSDNSKIDLESIEAWDIKLVEHGEIIYQTRKKFNKDIVEIFQEYYNIISNKAEKVNLVYQSQLNNNDFQNLLIKSLNKDRIFKFTTCGVHKDDFEFVLNGFSIKKYGSQGQQKSYILSLKFAQFDYLKQNLNLSPILLLDDIFDKLDEKRVIQITKLVSQNEFGQIFITDTCYKRMPEILKSLEIKSKILNLATNKLITNE